MITLFATIGIMRSICAIFMKIRFVGIMMNYMQRNKALHLQCKIIKDDYGLSKRSDAVHLPTAQKRIAFLKPPPCPLGKASYSHA